MKEIKKVLIGLFSIIMLLVVADWVVGSWSEMMYLKSKYGIFGRQIHCMSKSNEDFFIMGSSRAARHYQPQVFIDSLNISCYNAGSNGMCVFYSYALLATRIHKGAAPKNVLFDVLDHDIEVSNGATFTLDAALDRLAPHYGEVPTIDSLFALMGWKEKIKLLSKTYRFNSKLVQTIKCNYIPLKEDRGYEALFGQMDYDLYVKEKADKKVKTTAEIDDLKVYYFRKFISLCKDNGINLIICYSPCFQGQQPVFVDYIKKISFENNVPFINFIDDEDFADPKLFYDNRHLNDNGANVYSKKLANILKVNKMIEY